MSAAKNKLGRNPFEKPRAKAKPKRRTKKKARAKSALEGIDLLELLSVLTEKGPKVLVKRVRSCSYARAKKFVKSVLK